MLNNLNSPLLTLLAFGLSVFLAGNFLGSEWARRNNTKAEIKELQQKQKDLLEHLKNSWELARQRDSMTLAQVDSVCAILYMLDVKEGRIRGDLGKTKAGIKSLRDKGDKLKQDLAKQSSASDFDFAQ
jgi:hypothetical protein